MHGKHVVLWFGTEIISPLKGQQRLCTWQWTKIKIHWQLIWPYSCLKEMEHMKYLRKRPFGISFVLIFEICHFESWKKAKKSQIRNNALVLFPPFRLFGGECLGCTAEKGMTWPWRDLLKRYFTELIQLKYKLILWIKTMGCCGLACVVWLKSCEFSKRKSVLIVGNSSMMCLLRKFLNLTYLWTFFIFYQTEWTCWVFLLPVRS